MNRFLIPLLILLWALLYSWFWNCQRKPHCSVGDYDGHSTAIAIPMESSDGLTDDDTAQMAEDTVQMKIAEEEKLLFTPLDVYFETAKSSISRTAEIDNFLATSKKYLASYPDKRLSIVGHSDSEGSDETNQRVSVQRAELLKTMLVSEGFKASQIITSGMGEKSPIASNDSPEGRAQNRRATIRLAE